MQELEDTVHMCKAIKLMDVCNLWLIQLLLCSDSNTTAAATAEPGITITHALPACLFSMVLLSSNHLVCPTQAHCLNCI